MDDDTFHAIVERLRAAGVSGADVRGGGPGEQAHEADRVPGELGTYFQDPNELRLQILNHDPAHAASGGTLQTSPESP